MKNSIIDEIKSRISCPEYMRREHGSRIAGGRCTSFRPDAKNTSSLMVNERDWYDFGSGIGGDVIDLAAEDKFGGDKGKAIRYLAEKWGLRDLEAAVPQMEIVFKTYLALLDKAASYYQSELHERARNYLHGRGLTDETIESLRIGWAGNPCPALKEAGFTQQEINDSGLLSFVNRLMVPYLRNGKAVYFIGRESVWEDLPSSKDDAKYMKLYRSELSEHPIWGFDTLRRPGIVVIAEGIFDAISCWQEKYAVVTAVTGAFSAEQKKDLIPALKGRDVIVCMDYDPETKAGQKFTANLANELFEAGIRVSACFLKGEKEKIDLSSLYAMEPSRATLEKALAGAKNWEAVQIERIAGIENENTKRAELTAFLRRCATVFDWPTVAQLIADAAKTECFAERWLKELEKSLNKAPKELQVVEEFKKKFDCLYHESLGWYEYDRTKWVRKSEFEIRQQVAELYGQYRTAKNVDYSFLRRFCFISFPVKFVDELTGGANEMKKEPEIVEKLLKELPGIFNWAYQGLKELRKSNRFTETIDQTQMTRELVVMSNPLVSFVEEVIGNGAEHWKGQISKTEIYDQYNSWCKRTNTLPMSARSFWPRLRQVYPYRETRTGDGRYVEFTNPCKIDW